MRHANSAGSKSNAIGPHNGNCRESSVYSHILQAPTCRPAGHRLKDWFTSGGICDGCHSVMNCGEHVMDCRACDWFLCDACSGLAEDSGAAGSVGIVFLCLRRACVFVV